MSGTSPMTDLISGNGLLIIAGVLAALAIIVLIIALVLALKKPKLPPTPTVAVRRNRVNEPYVPPEVSDAPAEPAPVAPVAPQQVAMPVVPERPVDAPPRAPLAAAPREAPSAVPPYSPVLEPPRAPARPAQPAIAPIVPLTPPAVAPAPAPASAAATGPQPPLPADTGRVKALQPRLYCIAGFGEGNAYPLTAAPFVIGRDPSKCSFVYSSQSSDISRQHCIVRYDATAGRFLLEDNGSTNGTFLEDGGRLETRAPYALEPGARFYLANPGHQFEVNLSGE